MRSRVIPGSLVTIERRVPVSRLNKVDLPTFGRPTITSDAIVLFIWPLTLQHFGTRHKTGGVTPLSRVFAYEWQAKDLRDTECVRVANKRLTKRGFSSSVQRATFL